MVWPFNSSVKIPDRSTRHRTPDPPSTRAWRLLQVEPALACNLACVMCPWRGETGRADGSGLMEPHVWAAIKPWLSEAETLDFTGGGEPLMHPRLPEWIRDSIAAGCRAGFLTNGSLLTQRLARQLVDGGVDWIGFSVDGATADVYETIRPAADFNQLCDQVAHTVSLRRQGRPQVTLNFVMMAVNVHQLADMVRLAADLGVDRLNFKQCDVIRAVNDGNTGLFGKHRDKQIRSLEKQLKKARRLAERLGVATMAFAFSPDELPVCAQDPAHSLFIARDGRVAPCINMAYGGPSRFFRQSVVLSRLSFGRLPDQDLMEIWQTENCRRFRDTLQAREQAYQRVLADSQFEASFIKLEETFQAARDAMPPAADGCRVCHYLYGV